MSKGIINGGNDFVIKRLPAKPEMEFTKINNADTAAAFFASAQPMKSKSGVRKIPPPVPVRPDNNPIPAPDANACIRGGAMIFKVF